MTILPFHLASNNLPPHHHLTKSVSEPRHHSTAKETPPFQGNTKGSLKQFSISTKGNYTFSGNMKRNSTAKSPHHNLRATGKETIISTDFHHHTIRKGSLKQFSIYTIRKGSLKQFSIYTAP
jgi:hypothetical protein